MINSFQDTPAQAAEMNTALNELKTVPGPLMKALQKAQEIYGWLPAPVLVHIASFFDVPLEEIYGIATFYSQFNLNPSGKNKIGVCLGTACYVKGSGDILKALEEKLGVSAGTTTSDRQFTLEATRCIGCCGLAPVLTVNGEVYGKLTLDDVDKIVSKYRD